MDLEPKRWGLGPSSAIYRQWNPEFQLEFASCPSGKWGHKLRLLREAIREFSEITYDNIISTYEALIFPSHSLSLCPQFSTLANRMSNHISVLVNLLPCPQNMSILKKMEEGLLETGHVDLKEQLRWQLRESSSGQVRFVYIFKILPCQWSLTPPREVWLCSPSPKS